MTKKMVEAINIDYQKKEAQPIETSPYEVKNELEEIRKMLKKVLNWLAKNS